MCSSIDAHRLQKAGTAACSAHSVLRHDAHPESHQLLHSRQVRQQHNLRRPQLQALVTFQSQDAQAAGGRHRKRQPLESIVLQMELLNGCRREGRGWEGGCAGAIASRVDMQYLWFHMSSHARNLAADYACCCEQPRPKVCHTLLP